MFNVSLRKRGGMYFWRVGYLGGSFYVSRVGIDQVATINADLAKQRRLECRRWRAYLARLGMRQLQRESQGTTRYPYLYYLRNRGA